MYTDTARMIHLHTTKHDAPLPSPSNNPLEQSNALPSISNLHSPYSPLKPQTTHDRTEILPYTTSAYK